MDILLSIHPKWAKKIYNCEKTVEWRKSRPILCELIEEKTDKVFIYETAPVCRVTGYFVLESFRTLNIKHAKKFDYAKSLLDRGCVSYAELVKYQGDSDELVAWLIEREVKFDVPRTLEDFGFKRPPQSWRYINTKQ